MSPALALLAGLPLLASACGGSSSAGYKAPTGPAIQTVNIESGNLFFKPKKFTLSQPGVYEIKLTNSQSGSHTLVFGNKIKGFRLDVSGQGSFNEAKVLLNKGTYTFWCDVPGHRSAGMQGTITVT